MLSLSGLGPAQAGALDGISLETGNGVKLIESRTDRPWLHLVVYGQINQTLLAWDDGQDRDVYLVDNTFSSSRLGLKSRSDLDRDWSAGFQVELGIDNPGSNSVRAGMPDRTRPFIAGDYDPYFRIGEGWVNGPLGRLSIGLGQPVIAQWIPNPGLTFATDHGSFFLIGGAFNPILRSPTPGRDRLTRPWIAYTSPMQWPLANPVFRARYDSPSIRGFTFSAAQADEDTYDFGVRYKGQLGDFKAEVSLAYHHNKHPDNDSATPGFPEFERSLVGGFGIIHVPTGLFGVVGGNFRRFDGSDPNDFDTLGRRRPDDHGLWGEIGVRKQFFEAGPTTFYGVYGYGHDRGEGRFVPGTEGARWLKTRVHMWGVNAIQKIDWLGGDFADVSAYTGYRRWSGDFVRTTSAGDATPFTEATEPLKLFTAGLRVRF